MDTKATIQMRNALLLELPGILISLGIESDSLQYKLEYPVLYQNEITHITFINQVKGRVDVAAFADDTPIFFELKISSTDMKTGYGKNYTGKYNYLVVPATLSDAAERYLYRIRRPDVGILLFYGKQFQILRESTERNMEDSVFEDSFQRISYS